MYSDKLGALGHPGEEHVAIRVGDMVFDNLRSGGIPYDEFIADLGGLAAFETQFARMITDAF